MNRISFFVGLVLVAFVHLSVATSIRVRNHFVNKSNADEFFIGVVIHKNVTDCTNNPSASDVYINIPEVYHEAKVGGVNVSIEQHGKLLLDVPSGTIRLDEFMGFKPFFGKAIFCVDHSLLSNLIVTISYKKGGHATDSLIVSGLDEWEANKDMRDNGSKAEPLAR